MSIVRATVYGAYISQLIRFAGASSQVSDLKNRNKISVTKLLKQKYRYDKLDQHFLCCFVVYSTRRFVVCLSVCHFVLVFFSPFSIAITSLGEERANFSAFRTFVRFVLV